MSESVPPQPRLGQFRKLRDVVGHASVIAVLCAQVRLTDRSAAVMLHGPEGVGKRTVARLFAKALICVAPTDDGDCCDQCEACFRFSNEGGLDHIEIDLSERRSAELIQYLREFTATLGFGRRKVVILLKADAVQPEVADLLLSRVEDFRLDLSFILLARDVRRARLAVASRCMMIGLRPLTPETAQAFVLSRLVELGIDPDDQIVDVLVAAGRGLPERLDGICARVADVNELSLAHVRRILGFDWVDEVVTRCCAMIDAWPAPSDVVISPAGRNTAEELHRM